MIENIKFFISKFQGEIKIAVISLIISSIVTIVFGAVFTFDAKFILIVAVASAIICLLLSILLNLKRFRIQIIERASPRIYEIEDLFIKSEFRERLNHFSDEKKILAETLVTKTLPRVFLEIHKDNPNMACLNLILDSGTTIAPVFRYLKGYGLPSFTFLENSDKKPKVRIYTNNLAGIREVYMVDPNFSKLSDRNFTLLGGQPLSNYRATTGEDTQKALDLIWEKQKASNGEILTLGIITANCFVGGTDLKNLSICARGAGHLEFKESIVDNANYLILLTPLGKLLRFDNVNDLNKILPKSTKGEYRQCKSIKTSKNAKKTYLLTSFRTERSQSPLANLSLQLLNACHLPTTTNYISCPDCPKWDPHGPLFEVFNAELPHHYIRDNFEKAYGYRPPSELRKM